MPSDSNPRAISNSEVGSFIMCKQKYWFEHVARIQPKVLSDPLAIGNLGHSALEAYGRARVEGATHEEAQVVGQNYLDGMVPIAGEQLANILRVTDILRRFHSYYQGFPNLEWLGVEQKHVLKLTDGFELPIRYDALMRRKDNGFLILRDYKFTYNFWQPISHDLNVQFPKYLAALQADGVNVSGAELVELRWREMKDQTPNKNFKITPYYPSIAKKRESLRQHINTSKQIVQWREQVENGNTEVITPLYVKFICDKCHFAKLCASQLDGGDIAYQMQEDFEPNTYGYNDDASILEGSYA